MTMPTPAGAAIAPALPSGEDLYPGVVGPDWERLPACVRALHSPTGREPARGVVTVRRGAHLLARLAGVLARFPGAGEHLPAELRVTATPGGQRWSRTFGGAPLVTDQAAEPGALLEFAGPFTLAFRLHAEGDALVFTQLPTRLGRPGFLLPWPAALSPRVTGRAWAVGADTARVEIVIQAPFVGLLVAYEGAFTVAFA